MQQLERKNGFLDLDKYYENIKRDNNITNYDLLLDETIIESYYSYGQYWLNINGKYYYFKPTEDLYEELIVSECAKFLNIPTVSYDLAIFNGMEGVISNSYKKGGYIYMSGMEILYDYLNDPNNCQFLEQMNCDINHLEHLRCESDKAEYLNNLEIIWQALEYRYNKLNCKVDIAKIMSQLIEYFCLNILVGQYDAFPQNWEIGESKKDVYLVPYYDGSKTLDKSFFYKSQSMSVSYEDRDTSNYRILQEFLKISSEDFRNIFLEKFNLMTLDNFLQIIASVEEKIGKSIPESTKKRIIASFCVNREEIEIIINNTLKVNGVR